MSAQHTPNARGWHAKELGARHYAIYFRCTRVGSLEIHASGYRDYVGSRAPSYRTLRRIVARAAIAKAKGEVRP